MNYVNKNNIVFNLQFCFRQRESTSHALFKVNENIEKFLIMEILAVESLVYLHFWYCRQTGTINKIGSWDWWKFKLLIWYISVRLANETRTIVILQAGMQANQFASAIDCAGNMAIFTKNCCGKISFFLKTQKRLGLKFFCLS